VSLKKYQEKRRFNVTPEPSGAEAERKQAPTLIYVIQKHRASQLHYDFRLEWNGVLLSWAVPKGPSTDPATKRLAMQVEDHPVDYADFEGVIPAGEYGGGTVMVWDYGTWEPEQADVNAALAKGDLKFTLYGKKLKGSWVLVRTRGFGSNSGKSSWLLIKHRDQYASIEDIAEMQPYSAKTKRLLADIAQEGGGDVAQAATGDPAGDAPKVTKTAKSAAPARPFAPRKAAKSPGKTAAKKARAQK
jgi:bifunctional non-homologous end joining protein LigD